MHQQLEDGLGRPTGNYVVTGASSGIGLAATTAVLSDECEPVSEWPVTVRVMPYRDGATQPERRCG
jgi:hypothetical protein